MRIELTPLNFIKQKIFDSDYRYKINLLCAVKFKNKNFVYIDLYFKTHEKLYAIYTCTDTKNNKQVVNIEYIDDIFGLKLHNVAIESKTNKIINIDYYIPKQDTRLLVADINDSSPINHYYISSNIFNLDIFPNGDITFASKVNLRHFNKVNSFEVLDKYFKDDKEYNFRKQKIKDDDEYTLSFQEER